MKRMVYTLAGAICFLVAVDKAVYAQTESTAELLEELRQLRTEVERRKNLLSDELDNLSRREEEVRKRKALLEEISALRGELRAIDSMATGEESGNVATSSAEVGMPLARQSPPTNEMVGEGEVVEGYDMLLGDWGGGRAGLAAAGIEVEAAYIGDIAGVISGDTKTGATYLDNVDLAVGFDLEQLFGWSNTTFMLYGLGNHGGDPSGEYSGDAQGIDNIEADDAWKIYELWIQKEWANGDFSALFGLYDLNGEFDVRDSAGLFINPSQGIGPDYSQAGENGPSIFPTTSLALRLRGQFSPTWYGQLAVLDGVPGDPDDATGTHIILDGDDGFLLAGEFGYLREEGRAAKYALGAWAYSAEFANVRTGENQRGNWGIYALADAQVYSERGDGEGLALTGRIGIADADVNQFGAFFAAGLVYSGLLPGRAEDQFGIGLAAAINGANFNDSREDAGLATTFAESALELTYRLQATPWLAIQPDIQYILKPGAVPGGDDALAFVVRTELAF